MMFSPLDFISLLVAISWLGSSDPDAYYLLDISPEMCLHATSHVHYSIRLSIILIYKIMYIRGSASDVYWIVRNSKTAFCAVWWIFAFDIGMGEILLTTTLSCVQIKLTEMLVFACFCWWISFAWLFLNWGHLILPFLGNLQLTKFKMSVTAISPRSQMKHE